MKKDFDCVQMKHDIQQKLMKEFEGLSAEEQQRITRERIAANPILGPIWKDAPRVKTTGLIEPEDSPEEKGRVDGQPDKGLENPSIPVKIRIMKRPRIYIDTSVVGGCFDDIFTDASQRLFEDVKTGKYKLIISETTLRELKHAPDRVQEVLSSLSPSCFDELMISDEIKELRDAYILAGVVGAANLLDAEHIAFASVAKADMIVSWNFRHIVHFDKIRGYHAVNLVKGYHPIPIYSPLEVVSS